jgi:hypothetical protein
VGEFCGQNCYCCKNNDGGNQSETRVEWIIDTMSGPDSYRYMASVFVYIAK